MTELLRRICAAIRILFTGRALYRNQDLWLALDRRTPAPLFLDARSLSDGRGYRAVLLVDSLVVPDDVAAEAFGRLGDVIETQLLVRGLTK